jgi:hypothetical protein
MPAQAGIWPENLVFRRHCQTPAFAGVTKKDFLTRRHGEQGVFLNLSLASGCEAIQNNLDWIAAKLKLLAMTEMTKEVYLMV